MPVGGIEKIWLCPKIHALTSARHAKPASNYRQSLTACVIWPKLNMPLRPVPALKVIYFNALPIPVSLVWNVHFFRREDGTHMAFNPLKKIWNTLSAIHTGVILLILVVIVSAAGTVILQRPATDPEEMQRAYSPQMLRLLDTLGLTNVFHAWWFVLLLVLVSLSIVAASVQRWPNSWRFYSRPYKSPDETFRKALPLKAGIPIPDEEAGLAAAERALRKAGIQPERIVRENSFSLFGERNRISELTVYIVHASLLLIFFGGIVDALWGWSGFVTLTRGEQSSQVQQQNGKLRNLPFSVRCDGAGQENYADGTPKRWWSDLAVVKDSQVVLRKQIVVNDPLVYGGARFYQASYGQTGKLDRLILTASSKKAAAESKDITLRLNETVPLDNDMTVRLAEFIPDYVVRDGQVYSRSNELGNPAAHLILESKSTGRAVNVWLPRMDGIDQNEASPYDFIGKDVQMAYFTGLEVSHEPGQWAVWAGVVVMGFGLVIVFYLVHMRVWVVPVRDARGRLLLWIGGAANKNKDVFEQRFRKLVQEIGSEIRVQPEPRVIAAAPSLAGR
jgi:cytochrome c biogenesis protein